jgi:hypothetical protein
MDPQQRLALKVAYKAVESAGYYGIRSKSTQETNVGCYLGVGSANYESNVGSADVNAFPPLEPKGLLSVGASAISSDGAVLRLRWTVCSSHPVGLVNNYGAAGSNTSIVLRAYTTPGTQRQDVDAFPTAYPIVFLNILVVFLLSILVVLLLGISGLAASSFCRETNGRHWRNHCYSRLGVFGLNWVIRKFGYDCD